MHREAEVLAAGGVVLRRSGKGKLKVLVVHRPAYDDWTIPKGKLDPGEGYETAAVREVEEETGVTCELGPELAPITYRDRRGRVKLVRYWVMTPVSGDPAEREPDTEIDEVRWVKVKHAPDLLSYATDRDLLAQAVAEVDG